MCCGVYTGGVIRFFGLKLCGILLVTTGAWNEWIGNVSW